jgi:ribulose-phosphate 3-epimerase
LVYFTNCRDALSIKLIEGAKMREKLICPSMMCANFEEITKEVKELEKVTDIFHMDIMDGHFVPNMALAVQDFVAIRKLTQVKMDAHLMVQDPKKFVPLFAQAGADIIYIHPEADQIPTATLKDITDLGICAGIAINPGTTVAMIEPLLNLVDYVMVMTVNPGFAGQKYLDFVDTKIDELASLKEKYGFKLMVDGAISPEKIQTLSPKGVDGFILGTSALFGKGRSYEEIAEELRGL